MGPGGCLRGPDADNRRDESLVRQGALDILLQLRFPPSVEREGRAVDSCARHSEQLQRLIEADHAPLDQAD